MVLCNIGLIRRKYMDTSNKFSCFILGEGTLPIQYTEVLLDHEYMVYRFGASIFIVAQK
jgi:hypothetical protein